jgi:hypothetical protein
MFLNNNKMGWRINPGSSSPWYPNTTFGYGSFDVKIFTLSGQTAFQMVNGSLRESIFHMTINMPQTNANGILLQNRASFGNLADIHIEAPAGMGTGNQVSLPSLTALSDVGIFDQDHPDSNIITGNSGYDMPAGIQQFWPAFRTSSNSASGSNIMWRGNPCPYRGNVANCNIIDFDAVPSTTFTKWTWQTGVQDTIVGRATTDTLTNKTLTNPTINGTGITGTPASANPTSNIAGGMATMTTGAISSLACGTTVTVSATGVTTTDVISWSFNAAPAANPGELIVSAWPTANNVNFQYCNPTAGIVTPNAATLNWRVVR